MDSNKFKNKYVAAFTTIVTLYVIDHFVSSQITDNWFLQLLITLLLFFVVVITLGGYLISNLANKAVGNFQEAVKNQARGVNSSSSTNSRSRAGIRGMKKVDSQVSSSKINNNSSKVKEKDKK